MGEGKTRAVALVGTVALHVLVVWWLGASPEAQARILRAMDMEVVDLGTEAEAEPEPEPEPVVEPEPEPEPEPDVPRPPRRTSVERFAEEPDDRPQADETSESSEPGEPDQPPGPRIIDFGEQNFALSGLATGWGMQASSGGSRYGLYRPGARGGGGGPSAGGGGLQTASSDFNPVPEGQLSRPAALIGVLERRYPEEARRRLIEGSVRLMVEVRATGRVRSVRVLTDPGGGLAEAASEAVRRARFRPALDRRGQPVDTRIVYTVRYILDD